MNRRSFLKVAGLGLAAITAGGVISPTAPQKWTKLAHTAIILPRHHGQTNAEAYLRAWSNSFRQHYKVDFVKTINRQRRLASFNRIKPKTLYSKPHARFSI